MMGFKMKTNYEENVFDKFIWSFSKIFENHNFPFCQPIINKNLYDCYLCKCNFDRCINNPLVSSILIIGPPGSGKTTFASQISFLLAQNGCKIGILGLEEPTDSIFRICDLFNWYSGSCKTTRSNMIPLFGTPNDILNTIKDGKKQVDNDQKKIKNESYDLDVLFMDGVSILNNSLGFDISYRETWNNLFSLLRNNKKLGIFVADDPVPEENYLQYQSDVVFSLNRKSNIKTFTFYVNKARYHDFHPGPHKFKILPSEGKIAGGIHLFPSMTSYINSGDDWKHRKKINKWYGCGVHGFDKLIGTNGNESIFFDDESLLIFGSTGTNKTTLAIQTMFSQDSIYDDEINGIIVLLDITKKSILRAINSDKENNWNSNLLKKIRENKIVVKSFLGRSCSAEEISEWIFRSIEKFKIKKMIPRLCFLGLESFLSSKQDETKKLDTITTLIRSLKQHDIISLFTFEIPHHFRKIGDIHLPFGHLFDTIITTKRIEERNEVLIGLYALKSIGRQPYNSMALLSNGKDNSLSVEFRRWPKVNIISGEAGNIREEALFLKFFYHNYSETVSNNFIFNEFRKRYPENEGYNFHLVYKDTISSEHWSFRGYWGSRHSNTKVLSLSKSLMDVLFADHLLENLKSIIPKDLILSSTMRNNLFWNKCINIYEEKASDYMESIESIEMVPAYMDLGVLVQNKKTNNCNEEKCKNTNIKFPRTIKELIDQRNSFNRCNDYKYYFIMPTIAPNRTYFMNFFIDIFANLGGDLLRNYKKIEDIRKIHDTNTIAKEILESFENGFVNDKDIAIKALLIILEIWDDEYVPSPLIGANYNRSLFSYRPLTKIEPYSYEQQKAHEIDDLENLTIHYKLEKEPSDFTTGWFPISTNLKRFVGDLYCFGIIRGALAPETAWILIDDLTQTRSNKLRAVTRRGLPIYKEMFDENLFINLPNDNKIFDSITTNYHNNNCTDKNLLILSDYPFYHYFEKIILSELSGLFLINRSEIKSKDSQYKHAEKIFYNIVKAVNKQIPAVLN